MKFGPAMMQRRARERRQQGVFYPKGFDITLTQAIDEFNLDEAGIQKLGELTAKRNVANAVIGHNVFYRRRTLEELFVDDKQAQV